MYVLYNNLKCSRNRFDSCPWNVGTKINPKFVSFYPLCFFSPFHRENGWCFLECYGFWGLKCLQCLDMGDASVGSIRGHRRWGHDMAALEDEVATIYDRSNKLKLHTLHKKRFTILLFVSWNKAATTGRAAEEVRADEESGTESNLMHQILQQALLWAQPARGRIHGIWFSKSLVRARLTTLSTLSENPQAETLSFTCMQGNTVYLTIFLATLSLLSVFTVSTTKRSLNASGNPLSSLQYRGKCKLQILVWLSTCQPKIWEKGEHGHSKDISKSIPVVAAKKIKETLKLAPVGQRSSELKTQPIACHTSVIQGAYCATFSAQRLRNAGDKVIEIDGIESNYTYGFVRQVQFLHWNLLQNNLLTTQTPRRGPLLPNSCDRSWCAWKLSHNKNKITCLL